MNIFTQNRAKSSLMYTLFLLLTASLNFTPLFGKETQENTKERLGLFLQSAYSTFPTIENSYSLAKTCLLEDIEGVFVECGVAAGSQIAAMRLACDEEQIERTIYLFDSFEGIPLAGPEDDAQPGVGPIRHATNVTERELLQSSNKVYPKEMQGHSCFSVDQVKANLESAWGMDTTNMVFVKGWFQDTVDLESTKMDKIALLRLDGDLYSSTKVCIEALFPKVVEGGYVIIDDYALHGCRRALEEYFAEIGYTPDYQTIVGGLGPVYFKK